MKAGGITTPVLAPQLDYRYTHLVKQSPEIRMDSVDELGPEFDRYRRTRIVHRQNAAPRTVSRLENDWFQAIPGQLSSSGEAGDACPDYDGFHVRRIFHRPGF